MPLGEYMRAVLKSNKRPKRKGWFEEHTIATRKSGTTYSFDDKKVTPTQLQEIRNRLKKESRKQMIRYLLVLIPVLVFVIWLFDYLFW